MSAGEQGRLSRAIDAFAEREISPLHVRQATRPLPDLSTRLSKAFLTLRMEPPTHQWKG